VFVLNRLALAQGLHAPFVTTSALVIFGLASGLHASGFLAVYLAGLVVGNTNGYSDIFFFSDNGIYANMFITPGFGYRLLSDTAPTALLRIARTGSTMSLQYDVGGGFQTLHSATHPNLADPMSVSVFLVNEFGDSGYHSAWFKNLDIVADQLLFPRQFVVTIKPASSAAVSLSWPSLANRHYQVEYRSSLTPNTWTDIGPQFPGTGGTVSLTNGINGQSEGYFRVREFP